MSKTQTIKEPNAIVRFYRETVGELRKVVWPTPIETRNLSALVLVVIISMSLLLGGFDYLFEQLFLLLIKVKI